MTMHGHVTTSTHRNGRNGSRSRGSRRVCASSPRQVHFYLFIFTRLTFLFLQLDYMGTKYKPRRRRTATSPPQHTDMAAAAGVWARDTSAPPAPRQIHFYFYFSTRLTFFTISLHALQTSITTNGHVTTSTHRNGGNSSSSRCRGLRRVCASNPRQVHFYLSIFYSTNFCLRLDYMRTKY
jgi:hypothetical protein